MASIPYPGKFEGDNIPSAPQSATERFLGFK
jgi:hypothetical protein